ncbi:MAG: alpha/beta hydrolase [Candidatus Omnitrophota bacterium]|jgi:pimeloyl-ACP methyl ester carboxylesterase
MLKEQSFNTGFLSINYAQSHTNGSPLVLLHGIISRWQYFLPIIPGLSLRWSIYALDLRGHGKSGRAKGQYQLENYVDDSIAFIQHKLTKPAVIFGHSVGGAIAILIAAKVPKAAKAIVVGDTPLCLESLQKGIDPNLFVAWKKLASSGYSVKELAARLADIPLSMHGQSKQTRLGDLPGMDAAFLEFEAKSLNQLDPEVLTPIIEGSMFEGYNNKQLLPAVSCPVLLVQGNPLLGAAMTDADVQGALSLLPQATHIRIENAGHELHLNQAQSVLRAVTYFIESL